MTTPTPASLYTEQEVREIAEQYPVVAYSSEQSRLLIVALKSPGKRNRKLLRA